MGLTSWLEVTDASDATGRASSAQLFSALWDALLPHLRRDEDEAMPLISVALGDAEWHAIDQEHFVKPA